MSEPRQRKVIHVDMDAFYASVEQRDRPELRGRPVVVGGTPDSRGVVCAASYEARRFGVRSAMPCATAYKRCPQAVFIRPDIKRYRAVSQQIHAVFRQWTDQIEPLALDEAYLDVTENHQRETSATRVAEGIRAAIQAAENLTASAGVAGNKLVAKIASDANKPDGLCVVPPDRAADFLAKLPVRVLPGIGPVAERRCHDHGLQTFTDLRQADGDKLTQVFGSRAESIQRRAWGIDDSPVRSSRKRKSISVEDTAARDLTDLTEIRAWLETLVDKLETRCQRADVSAASTLVLKVKYHDFHQITRSHSWPAPEADPLIWRQTAQHLLGDSDAGITPIRLLGVGLANLDKSGARQQTLF